MSRILLVEDDAALRSAYEMILHKQGFQLTSVENGLEALNMIKQKKFDLILLDIMMPILDGVGFLKKANLHKLLPNVRLVVFSNLSSGNEIDEVKKLGAHRVLLKANVSPRELTEILNQELAIKN